MLELTKNLFSTGDAGWTGTPDARDQEALIGSDAANLESGVGEAAGRSGDFAPDRSRFPHAAEAGKTAEAWRQSAKIVRSVLGGPWDEQQRQAAQNLVRYLPLNACPQGNAWLNMELLFAEKPQGEELLNRLQSIAEACGKYPEGDEIVNRLLAWVVRTRRRPTSLAIALGRMAEATMGTALMQKVLEQYVPRKKGITAEQLAQVRRQLALAGAPRSCCGKSSRKRGLGAREVQKKLQALLTEILGCESGNLPGLCSELTMLLAQPEYGSTVSSWHSTYSSRCLVQGPNGPWLAELLAAMADAIPFGPLTEEYRRAFADLPGGNGDSGHEPAALHEIHGRCRIRRRETRLVTGAVSADHAAWQEMHRLPPRSKSRPLPGATIIFCGWGSRRPKTRGIS